MKIKHFDSVEQIEMCLLKNIGVLENFNDREIKFLQLIDDNFSLSFLLNKMIYKTEEEAIFIDENKRYKLILDFNNTPIKDINVGDINFIYFNEENPKIINVAIQEFDENNINKFNNILQNYTSIRYDENNMADRKEIFNIQFIENEIEKIKKNYIKDESEEESEIELQEKESNNKFINGESFIHGAVEIGNNYLKSHNFHFIFQKNLNSFLDFNSVKSLCDYEWRLRNKVMNLKQDLSWIVKGITYSFVWKSEALYINNVRINKVKQEAILNRIEDNNDGKPLDLRLLNRISGIMFDFYLLNHFEYRDYFLEDTIKVPISIELIDEKNKIFKVKLFDKEAEKEWKVWAELFTYGRNVHTSMDTADLFKIYNLLGYTSKEEIFENMKKLRTIHLLKKSSEEK